MKNFYKVSNTIENGPRMDRKRTVVGPMKDRQWSRISPINHRLWTVIAPMLFVAFGLFGVNESAWGLDQYVIVEDFNNSTKYDGTGLNHITSSGFSNKVNHVTFTIAGVAFSDSWGDNRLDYSSQSRNSELSSPITWEADPNYDVCVTKVLMGVRGYQSVISPKTANAYLTDGTTTTGTQDCKTNGTGTKTFEISAAKINSPLSLVKSTGGNSTTYKIPTITFTYKVTHKRYQYGFDAVLGGVMNSSYGTATATGGGTVYNDLTETTASKQVTFTATPTNTKDYKFVGWYSDAECTNQVSKENPYTPTLYNSTAGSVNTLTLYAKFDVKGTPVVTCDIEDEYEIGHEPIDLQTLWTREGNGAITYSIVPNSFVASGTNNTGAVEPALSEGRYLSLGQAGTLQLKMVIDADGDEYLARTVTKDITINKITNTLYVNGIATYKPEMRMGQDLSVTLTATNTDYTNYPIQLVEQTEGDETVAVFDYMQSTRTGTVHSKYTKNETATWSIHQDENYMYQAGNNTFSVDVKLAATACDYVLEEVSEHHVSFYTNNGGLSYDLSAPGETLYIKVGKESSITTQTLYIYGYDANSNETTIASYDPGYLTADGEDKEIPISENIVKIKIQAGGTQYKWFSNLRVSRKVQLEASAITIDKTSTNNPVYPSDGTGVGVLPVTYLLAGGGDLHIYNDNPKFTVLQPTISNASCQSEAKTTNIGIQYNSAAAGTDYAHLVIYNDCYRKEVTITGITSLRTQVINWEVGDVVRLGSETENAAWVITGNTVNFSSSATDIIDVVDGKLVAKGIGSAVITATADAKGDYAAAYDTKTIEVTNDEIQWIDWNQTFLRLKLGGSNVTLTASAQSDVEGCTTEGARPITYSSADESVVRIVNTNQLQIVGAGTTVITATQAGGLDTDGHKYMAVSKEKTVIVRNPNAPCVNYLYVQPDENEWYCGWNHLNRQYKEFVIDNLVDPSDISLQYKGEYKRAALTDYFYGTMQVEEWYEGEWHDISGTLSPQIGNYQTFSHALNRNTTKVRISTHSGVGYHYFKDCKIGQARYIETNTLSAYEAKVGQKVDQKLSISYDNIVGDISLTLGHTPSNFSVSQNVITGDCGDRATVDVTVSYIPAAATVGEGEEETLTITDGTTTTHVNLSGSATVTDRYISWNQESPASKYTVESVTLTASALTTVGNHAAGDVFYTLGGLSTTGVLSGTINSTLTFANAGVAYVSAQGKASALYNTPAAVTRQFNVELTPTEVVEAPTIGSVVSGTALSDITVSGGTARDIINQGSVSGTFTVQNGNVTDVGPNKPVTVKFTPEDGTMYDVCTYNMYIEVTQRPATDEEIGTVTADHITFGDKLSDAVLSMSGTLNGHGTLEMTDPQKDEVKDVDTYENLKVLFTPDNTNIAPKELTVSVTVDKADPAVTPQATDITYGQPISASNITTASGDVAGSWAWAVDDTQVLSVGDHVLKANFTSDSANYNNLSNVDVTLKVKKIETLEVEVPLSFCAGGSETFHGKTYTTAGTDQINAVGATRDTVYNVTVTVLQPTTGTDSKTITVGDNESWHGIDLSSYAVGSHEVEYHTTNVAGCDSTVTLSLTVTAVVPVGPNTFTNNAGDNDWQNAENWTNGVPSGVNPDVIISGVLIIDESVTVGGLTILPSGSVTVVESGTLTVNGESADHSAYGDLHVTDDGNVVLGNSANLKVRDFILDAKLGDSSTQAASGQVKGNGALNVIGDAYFQMKFDPSGAITYGWYDFVVPFEVNTNGGIYRVEANDDLTPMTSGVDFLVQSFSEAKCAAGQKAWTNFSGTMMPGQGYTITFNYQPSFNQNTFLFKKKAGATIGGSNTYSAVRTFSGEESEQGWNVLGNGTLQHIELAENLKIQIFEHASNSYQPFVATEKTIAVGTSFQVQVFDAQKTIVMSTATDRPILAPKREVREVEEFRLSLTAEGEEKEADRLWISASEEATGAYWIGHDLLKKGTMTNAKVARMWCTRNGKQLCDVEMPMVNGSAENALGLFTPNAGQYTLAIEEAPADASLYLTYNGAVIWDLTASPYVFDLTKGTTEGYGLRIEAANAPQVTTGVGNGGLMNDANSVRKVIIDNKMYIITPEGAIFDVIGKKVQ